MAEKSGSMHRVTMTFDEDLVADIDAYMATTGQENRSEAIRDLVRDSLKRNAKVDDPKRQCVGAVVYVYDHETRELAKRILHDHHEHNDLSIASLHVHLDDHSCLEVSLLKGKKGDVEHFGRHVISERGVRYGELVIVPANTTKIDELPRSKPEHKHTHKH